MANWGIMPWGLLAIPSAWEPSQMEIFMAFGLMGDPAHLLLENRQKISFRLVIEWTFSQKEKFFHPILWTVSPLPPPPLLYSRYFCSNPRTLNLEVLGISLFFFFFKEKPKGSGKNVFGKSKIFYYFNQKFSWRGAVPKHLSPGTVTMLYRYMLKKEHIVLCSWS